MKSARACRFCQAAVIFACFTNPWGLVTPTQAQPPSPPLASQNETREVFRYHIRSEPVSLDPARLSPTEAGHFYNNVMRGLYSYSNKKGLVPEGAKECFFKTPLKLVCTLSERFWSDGTKTEAGDYVRAFRRLVAAESKSQAVDLLKKLKNAQAIHAGRVPPDKLGVEAPNPERLTFEFSSEDPEFLFKLSSSVLVPVRSDTFPPAGEIASSGNGGVLFNGPYKISSWQKGRRLYLEPNSHFRGGNPQRPPVEILFIDEDETALTLYEQKKLTFLRHLPTAYVAKYRSRADFQQISQARFDYIGFGPELRQKPDLRAALSLAADFEEMRKLVNALGRPGCPGLPEAVLDRPRCVTFDPNQAHKHLEKVSPGERVKRLKLFISKLSSDDLKPMEWLQGQWRKNLGIQVELEQIDFHSYLDLLRQNPPAIFRKGVSLERPTCLAALETFAPDGSENFLKIDSPAYAAILDKLNQAIVRQQGRTHEKTSLSAEIRRLCGEGVQFLIDGHFLIPLGRMHFTMLADPRFKNWSLNEVNQLDLAQLIFKP